MAIFDRFIRYTWTEHALELAVNEESPLILHDWLLEQGLGKESARRTGNLLYHLWFKADPTTNSLRQDAFALFRTLDLYERLALHWGMAIIQFSFFREIAQVIGRLGHLQGEFTKSEVVGRILEKYSNQTTIQRATERVIQTMVDWNAVELRTYSRYGLASIRSIQTSALAEWLIRAKMAGAPEKYWLVHDLLSATESFPFELGAHSRLLYISSYFTVGRDSFGAETVGLRYF